VLLPDGKPCYEALVALEGTRSVYFSRLVTGHGGTFKFSKLEASTYQLMVSAAGWGALQKTVLVGPAYADKKGRIEKILTLEPESAGVGTVTANQLSIPEAAAAEYRKALKKLEELDTAGAKEHLAKAIEIAHHYAGAWNRLGIVAYKEGDYPEAERCFGTALSYDGESYSPLVNLGGVLLLLGKLDAALDSNLKAVARRSDDPLAQSQLGCTYFALDELDKALVHLQTARELDPGHFSNPQLVLAEIYRLRGEFGAVAKELEEFLALHPDYPLGEQLKKLADQARQKSN